jgi:hypothetical protein
MTLAFRKVGSMCRCRRSYKPPLHRLCSREMRRCAGTQDAVGGVFLRGQTTQRTKGGRDRYARVTGDCHLGTVVYRERRSRRALFHILSCVECLQAAPFIAREYNSCRAEASLEAILPRRPEKRLEKPLLEKRKATLFGVAFFKAVGGASLFFSSARIA